MTINLKRYSPFGVIMIAYLEAWLSEIVIRQTVIKKFKHLRNVRSKLSRLLINELTLNTHTFYRIEKKKCRPQQWWKKRQTYWNLKRAFFVDTYTYHAYESST